MLTNTSANKPLGTALIKSQADASEVPDTTWLSKIAQKKAFASLSVEQQCMREIFVREYLYDFHMYNAACRTGIPDHKAAQWATAIMLEPWVKNRIKEVIEELDEKIIVSRNRVLMGLLEEAQRFDISASHSARVGAWDKIASVLGMKLEKTEMTHAFKGGVMIVPASGTVDEWSTQATKTQADLKTDVRT